MLQLTIRTKLYKIVIQRAAHLVNVRSSGRGKEMGKTGGNVKWESLCHVARCCTMSTASTSMAGVNHYRHLGRHMAGIQH